MDELFLKRFLKTTPLLCAFMVVGIHSYNAAALPKGSVTAIIESVFSHGLFTAAVPVFFMISAYLFYRNADSLPDVIRKQKRRIQSLLLPFISWSFLYYVVYAVLSRVGVSGVTVDLSLLGILKGVIFYKYIFPLWFLFALIVYTALAPLIFYVLKCRWGSLCLWAAVIVLGVLDISLTIRVDGSNISLFSANYFAYYFAGALAAKNKELFIKAEEKLLKINTKLCIVLLLVFSIAAGFVFDYELLFNKRILIPFVVFFAFVLLDKLSLKAQNSSINLNKVSTMTIYGGHTLITALLSKVLISLSFPLIIVYAVVFVSAVSICTVFGFVIKKIPFLNLIFCGNRK